MDVHSWHFHRDRPDTRALREAFGRFATGVTVVTTRTPEGKLEGLTVNSFSSLSLDPPMLLWSIDRRAPSLAGFRRAGHFAVNVLRDGQQDISQRFSRPAVDKFSDLKMVEGINGCPLIPNALAVFECEVAQMVEAGDHQIVLGNVVRADVANGDPLLYVGGQYSRPERAPGFGEVARFV